MFNIIKEKESLCFALSLHTHILLLYSKALKIFLYTQTSTIMLPITTTHHKPCTIIGQQFTQLFLVTDTTCVKCTRVLDPYDASTASKIRHVSVLFQIQCTGPKLCLLVTK